MYGYHSVQHILSYRFLFNTESLIYKKKTTF